MRLIWQAVALLTLAVVCAAASNAMAGRERRLAWKGAAITEGSQRPASTPAAGSAAPVSAASSQAGKGSFSPHPDKPYVEISGGETSQLHGRGDVPFLDARRTSVYREGHIAGARPLSVWESDIDDKVKAFFAEGHDPSGPIVVYCSGGECEDSHTLAQKLYLAGFDAVFVYKDGFPDWQRRGLPVHSGDRP
ncbi:MAG TPA: rhodanese-like domain-containing protein [Thermoanaerobaculia bacterium]|nr:rhodanese-like domain-containing protein [Thermoanaerobaculia bacterium]